ncbi:MAG: UspA domain protein [Marmoricola sp.]|nr:UspA domain protein [Marmoricola sp.]
MKPTSLPIVVAFDGSDESTLALHWAVDTAGRTHQEVRAVVAAMDPNAVAPPVRQYEEEFADSAAALARDIVKHSHAGRGSVDVKRGLTVPVLLEEAAGAALMVVGSRGRGVIESHWLGSVSQHLAGHAAAPVAVIRAAHNPRSRTILVGIDGSPASLRAVGFACDRAALSGEEVVAVYAYRYPTFYSPGLAVLPEDVDTTLVDSAERLASDLVAGVRIDYPDVALRSTAVVGRPARVLARLSDDACLVVVGSRGRNAFKEMLLGSVAREVLHRGECPVVVVR